MIPLTIITYFAISFIWMIYSYITAPVIKDENTELIDLDDIVITEKPVKS